jgi:RHS repeat-associated protein
MYYEIGWQDYGMRIYRPDIGRFGSVDPITSQYPELTPFQFASNSPIGGIDLDGLEYAVPLSTLYGDKTASYLNQSDDEEVIATIDGMTALATGFVSAAGNGFAFAVGRYKNSIDKPFSALGYSKNGFQKRPINENFDGSISQEDGGRLVAGILDASALGGLLVSNLSRSTLKLGLSMDELRMGANAAKQLKLLPQGMVPNAGGNIVSFTTLETETYYRVFSSNPNGGAFLTKVAPKSSTFARQGLALPNTNTASFIQEVSVPSGVILQRSRALPAFGRRGGLEQFQILNYDSRIRFNKGVRLK